MSVLLSDVIFVLCYYCFDFILQFFVCRCEVISVLLAAYNGSKWLHKQINSILLQKNINVTIFLSVDLSSDSTLSICMNYAEIYKNIFLLPYGQSFGGASPNFYRLIRDVDLNLFDYISFSDQDDIWLESKLINAVSTIKLRQVAGYAGDVTAFWPDGRKKQIIKSQPQRRLDYIFESAGPGCTFVINRDLALSFKQFLIDMPEANKFIFHDWLLYAFSRSRGYKWYIDPSSYILYRQHENNQVGANASLSTLLKRFKLAVNGAVGEYVDQLLYLLSGNEKNDIPQIMDFKAHIYFIKNWCQLRRRVRDRYLVLLTLVIMLFLYHPARQKKRPF